MSSMRPDRDVLLQKCSCSEPYTKFPGREAVGALSAGILSARDVSPQIKASILNTMYFFQRNNLILIWVPYFGFDVAELLGGESGRV